MFSVAGVVDEDDVSGDLVFAGVEFFDGEDLGEVGYVSGDALGGGGGAPAGGVDVEVLDAGRGDLA